MRIPQGMIFKCILIFIYLLIICERVHTHTENTHMEVLGQLWVSVFSFHREDFGASAFNS